MLEGKIGLTNDVWSVCNVHIELLLAPPAWGNVLDEEMVDLESEEMKMEEMEAEDREAEDLKAEAK